MKNIINLLMLCAVLVSFALTGCGTSDTATPPIASSTPNLTVYGVAALDTTAGGIVSVKDSSVPAQERTGAIDSNGEYTLSIGGLKKPFILKAEGINQAGGRQTLYSLSEDGGRANIDPLSDIAVAASTSDGDGGALYNKRQSDDEHHKTTDRFGKVIDSLRTVLAPLFALYQTSGGSDDDGDNTGLRAMLLDVRFAVKDGWVTVTNRKTGGIIFYGSLKDLASGTFYPENMPGGTGGSTACTYTYDIWGACQSNNTQTRTLLTTLPAGCTGTPVLSQACTYVPPTPTACTYNYSGWGECQTNNTQTRTMLQATPAGCTGTPVLSQSCTYVPPTPTACTYTYNVWGSCQSNNTQTRSLLTSSPAGCTGTPVLSQSCTYVAPSCTYTYNTWNSCQTNNTQTRSLLTSSPAGCTGTPILSQSCTYVAPSCTYTYNTWNSCQTDNTQTRSLLTSSPAGCTGTPILTQSCTYVAPSCTYTYNSWGSCQTSNTQTRSLLTSSPAGCTGTPILTQSCTYVAPSCTYTYNPWGSCQSNNTQTRSLLGSSPAGCTGTPLLSQSCTYVPPAPTVTLANVTASCTTCHGLKVNTTVLKSGGYTVTGRSASSWLSTVNSMVNMGASLAAGTTAQGYANFLAALP